MIMKIMAMAVEAMLIYARFGLKAIKRSEIMWFVNSKKTIFIL